MYLEGTLSKDEEIKVVAKKHWFCYVKAYFLAVIGVILILMGFTTFGPLMFPFALLVFLLAGIDYIKVKCIEMIVTNKRIALKTGIFNIKTTELKNSKVESIELTQDIFGMLWGFGNITFCGTGISQMTFTQVENPKGVKSQLDEIIGN